MFLERKWFAHKVVYKVCTFRSYVYNSQIHGVGLTLMEPSGTYDGSFIPY